MQTPRRARVKQSNDGKLSNGQGVVAKVAPQSIMSSPIKLAPHAKRDSAAGTSSDKVTVCVKVRPVSSPESLEAYELDPDRHTLSLSDSHSRIVKRGRKSGRRGEYTYSFDALHVPPSRTASLYQQNIAPLVLKCMTGFNSTIFAYGQTGSGKTHTMSGVKDDVGIIPLAIDTVFAAIDENPDRHYLLRVSYLEIYNESIRDILLPPKRVVADNERPVIHVENGAVQVRPLVEEIVKRPQDILKLLERGMHARKTGATDWNERSSRSHTVFTLTIESRAGADIRSSKLTLIDLAGSEKAASDVERLAEGKYINKSLLALGTVIEALADCHKKAGSHIPYRNSKLTHLLENALGGNANIAVICTLSLEEHHQAETLETLKFASRCAQVQTKATQGIVAASEKAMLQAKEEEIAALKTQLEEMSRRPPPLEERELVKSGSKAEIAMELEELEARRNRVFNQLTQLNGEILSGQSNSVSSDSRRLQRRVSDHVATGSFSPSTPLLATPVRDSRRAVSGGMAKITQDGAKGSANTSGTFTSEDIIKVARYHRHHLSSQVNELTADLSVSDLSRTSLELEVKNLTLERDEWENKFRNEHRALTDLQTSTRDAEKDRTSQEERIADLEAALRRLEQQRALTQADTAETSNRVLQLESQLTRERTDSVKSSQHVSFLESKLVKEEAEKSAAAEEISRLEVKVRQAAQEKKQLKSWIDKLELQCKEDESDRAQSKDRMSKLEVRLAHERTAKEQAQEQSSKFEGELAKERSERADTDARVVRLEKQLNASVTESKEAQQEMEQLKEASRSKHEANEKAAQRTVELEDELKKQSVAKDLAVQRGNEVEAKLQSEIAEKRTLQSTLDQMKASMATMNDEVSRVREKKQQLELAFEKMKTLAEERQDEVSRERKEKEQLLSALNGSKPVIEEQQVKLLQERKENQRLQLALAEMKSLAEKREDEVSQERKEKQRVAALVAGLEAREQQSRGEIEQALGNISELEEGLQTAQNKNDQYQKQLAELTASHQAQLLDSHTTLETELQKERAETRSALRRADEMEQALKEQQDGAASHTRRIALLEAELKQERLEKEKAQQRVSKLNEIGLPKLPADRDLSDQPTSSTRQPLRHTGSLKESRYTSMDTATPSRVEPLPYSVSARVNKSREDEEIEKLGKVIEGLKNVQDELLSKIAEWQTRVLDQNRRIQALTEELLANPEAAFSASQSSPVKVIAVSSPPQNPITPPRPSRLLERPILTPSKSIRSNMSTAMSFNENTDHATPRRGLKPGFSVGASPGSSWFVQDSPKPIPMHDGMKSNSSARKRRLTVENDLERLQQSSRVDEARMLFTREKL